MKHLILLTALLFLFIGNTHAQIGSTQKDTENSLTASGTSYTSGLLENGLTYVRYFKNETEFIQYYNKQTVCVFSIIIPGTTQEAMDMKKSYDLKYTKLTDSTWKHNDINVLMDTYEDRYLFTFN